MQLPPHRLGVERARVPPEAVLVFQLSLQLATPALAPLERAEERRQRATLGDRLGKAGDLPVEAGQRVRQGGSAIRLLRRALDASDFVSGVGAPPRRGWPAREPYPVAPRSERSGPGAG
jgi:hypothetical protein